MIEEATECGQSIPPANRTAISEDSLEIYSRTGIRCREFNPENSTGWLRHIESNFPAAPAMIDNVLCNFTYTDHQLLGWDFRPACIFREFAGGAPRHGSGCRIRYTNQDLQAFARFGAAGRRRFDACRFSMVIA